MLKFFKCRKGSHGNGHDELAFFTRLTNRLTQRDRQKIREIDAALDRLNAGTYGKCEDCGQEIGSDRLRALPVTTFA